MSMPRTSSMKSPPRTPMKPQRTIIRAVRTKPPVIKLTPEDLQEWHLRRATVNTAKFQSLMVEEAYTIWAKTLRTKYGIPTVKFEIDPQTGIVRPKEEHANE